MSLFNKQNKEALINPLNLDHLLWLLLPSLSLR